jgi:hypothetical protein
MPDWEWASHQPMIRTIMELLNPQFILELGIGLYSTGLLNEKQARYQGEEQNLEWYNKFHQYNIQYYDMGEGICIGSFARDLSEDQRQEIRAHYEALPVPDIHPNLLFVDNYTCTRAIAIKALYDKFDCIIYHDCQPEGIPWYEYYFDEGLNQKFEHYYLRSSNAWTGCFIKNGLLTEERMHESCKVHIGTFIKECGKVQVLEKKCPNVL